MRKIGPDLINTCFEFDDFRKRGGRAVLKKPFKPGDPLSDQSIPGSASGDINGDSVVDVGDVLRDRNPTPVSPRN